MYIYIYNICVFLSSLFIHHLRVRSLARIVRWWTWCIFGSVGTVETPHQIDRTWISLRQTEIWTSTLKTNSKKKYITSLKTTHDTGGKNPFCFSIGNTSDIHRLVDVPVVGPLDFTQKCHGNKNTSTSAAFHPHTLENMNNKWWWLNFTNPTHVKNICVRQSNWVHLPPK